MARKEKLELSERFLTQKKLIDVYKVDIPKLESKAKQSGYNNLKNYLEDVIHKEAQG